MGAMFINKLDTTGDVPTLNYTMIANELVVTRVYYRNSTKTGHFDGEIQRRYTHMPACGSSVHCCCCGCCCCCCCVILIVVYLPRSNIINMMHNAFFKFISGVCICVCVYVSVCLSKIMKSSQIARDGIRKLSNNNISSQ